VAGCGERGEHKCPDVTGARYSQVRTPKMGSRLGTGPSEGRNAILPQHPSLMAAWAGEDTRVDIGYRPNLRLEKDGGREEGRKGGREEGRKGGREEGRDEVLHSRQQNSNHRCVGHSKEVGSRAHFVLLDSLRLTLSLCEKSIHLLSEWCEYWCVGSQKKDPGWSQE
jgi:hypothetical protein